MRGTTLSLLERASGPPAPAALDTTYGLLVRSTERVEARHGVDAIAHGACAAVDTLYIHRSDIPSGEPSVALPVDWIRSRPGRRPALKPPLERPSKRR